MSGKLLSWSECKVWKLFKLPNNKRAIQVLRKFDIKVNAEDSIAKLKVQQEEKSFHGGDGGWFERGILSSFDLQYIEIDISNIR